MFWWKTWLHRSQHDSLSYMCSLLLRTRAKHQDSSFWAVQTQILTDFPSAGNGLFRVGKIPSCLFFPRKLVFRKFFVASLHSPCASIGSQNPVTSSQLGFSSPGSSRVNFCAISSHCGFERDSGLLCRDKRPCVHILVWLGVEDENGMCQVC